EEDDRLRAGPEAERRGLGREAAEPPKAVDPLGKLPFLPVEASGVCRVPEVRERLPPRRVRPVPAVADLVQRRTLVPMRRPLAWILDPRRHSLEGEGEVVPEGGADLPPRGKRQQRCRLDGCGRRASGRWRTSAEAGPSTAVDSSIAAS